MRPVDSSTKFMYDPLTTALHNRSQGFCNTMRSDRHTIQCHFHLFWYKGSSDMNLRTEKKTSRWYEPRSIKSVFYFCHWRQTSLDTVSLPSAQPECNYYKNKLVYVNSLSQMTTYKENMKRCKQRGELHRYFVLVQPWNFRSCVCLESFACLHRNKSSVLSMLLSRMRLHVSEPHHTWAWLTVLARLPRSRQQGLKFCHINMVSIR